MKQYTRGRDIKQAEKREQKSFTDIWGEGVGTPEYQSPSQAIITLRTQARQMITSPERSFDGNAQAM
ncbi:hypothetical protein DF186_17780, partial [Enterococcus hirae]